MRAKSLGLAVLLPVVAACSTGSAVAATHSYGLTSFDRIRVSGPFDVHVHVGGSPSARATGPQEAIDRLSVEQIFGNLIDNAVKYLDPERPGRIVVRAEETPMGIVFEVEDNGRGIDAKDHERVFDLFRRAGSQDRPGEGIGLSHVKALVRRLGGSIFLRSEVGVGTTFVIRLPRVLAITEERKA